MSSPSERFECRWQGSRLLLAGYVACLLLALIALIVLAIPLFYSVLGIVLCLAHAVWCVPRHILLTHPAAITGLRRDAFGWHLWSRARGWHAVQLRRDSVAVPGWVVLRFRRQGRWISESLCLAPDTLEPVQHRRLRVRLKFSRRRWAAAE